MKDAFYDEFIERVRSESDIVTTISDYISLKKNGKNYWGCCPFHNEKTPSFSVTPDKGFFYCFG
ncbi:MAG: primase, partial [Firmicutes bacterium]|nr:primase [Bacillota bacterium]